MFWFLVSGFWFLLVSGFWFLVSGFWFRIFMFLLDDILLFPLKAPVSGFRWIMKQIQTMADEELMNDQPWKERLIELQMMLELGEISEEEYGREEAQVFTALRDIRARREEVATDGRRPRRARRRRRDRDLYGIRGMKNVECSMLNVE